MKKLSIIILGLLTILVDAYFWLLFYAFSSMVNTTGKSDEEIRTHILNKIFSWNNALALCLLTGMFICGVFIIIGGIKYKPKSPLN